MPQSDTIYALASGRPPAAIAIIRVSGPLAHGAAALLAGDLPAPRQAAVRALRGAGGMLLDEALVLRFDGPASATGEDLVELHCHGGRAVVDSVLGALSNVDGLRLAQPGEFTRRGFENGRIDLTEAEGLADLLEAETESQRRAALAIAEGGLKRQIDAWRTSLLTLSASAEAAIDYADDDQTEADKSLARNCGALAKELESWLDRPRAEPLKEGVRVVIAGPPNAGKSSLLNALAGSEKAIVTDIPGTTRDRIEVPLAIGGTPLLLVDTAGLRDSDDPVEQMGVARARSVIDWADILLWLGGAAEAPAHPRLLIVHSKCDLPGRAPAGCGSLPVSAVTGEGLSALTAAIVERARALLPAEGDLALNARQAGHIADAQAALQSAVAAGDLVLVAESLRSARSSFDRLTGRAGVEDMLDALFGRFCLGK